MKIKISMKESRNRKELIATSLKDVLGVFMIAMFGSIDSFAIRMIVFMLGYAILVSSIEID